MRSLVLLALLLAGCATTTTPAQRAAYRACLAESRVFPVIGGAGWAGLLDVLAGDVVNGVLLQRCLRRM